MKLQDKETLNVADAVKDVLEGKVKKEEVKYPHDMFHPETGEKEVAKDEDEHKALSKKGYTHEKPKNESPEEPKAKGEKEFKDKHSVKKTGADEKGQVTSESKHDDEDEDEDSKEEGNAFGKAVMAAKDKGDKTFVFAGKKYDVKTKSEVKDEDEDDKKEVEEELSAKQKKYRAFFDKALKKFGVKSPDELEGDKKKEFFDYVDANYEADNESD